MPELAKRAISKLETRKYKFPSPEVVRVPSPVSDVYSSGSGLEQCAICLEEYKESQVLHFIMPPLYPEGRNTVLVRFLPLYGILSLTNFSYHFTWDSDIWQIDALPYEDVHFTILIFI